MSPRPAPPMDAESDARLGMVWWNGLSKAARAMWLDRAWKRASPKYTLDSMPSAANAWAEFKNSTVASAEEAEEVTDQTG